MTYIIIDTSKRRDSFENRHVIDNPKSLFDNEITVTDPLVVVSHLQNIGSRLDDCVNRFCERGGKWAVIVYSTSSLSDQTHANPNVYFMKRGVPYSEAYVRAFEYRIKGFIDHFKHSEDPKFELLEPMFPAALLAYYCCKRAGIESCQPSDAAYTELVEQGLDQALLECDDVEPLREALLRTLSDRITSWR